MDLGRLSAHAPISRRVSGLVTKLLAVAVLAAASSAMAFCQGGPAFPYTPYAPLIYQQYLESRQIPMKMTEVRESALKASPNARKAKTPGDITLMDEGGGGGGSYGARIMVIVNDALYPSVETKVLRYVDDLEAEGYSVVLYRCTGGTVEALRAYLLDDYETNDLQGVVCIGRVPYALYEEMFEIYYFAFPCDWYLMDLDSEWLDTNPFPEAQTGVLDGYANGENPGPEIFVGRIDASNLSFLGQGNEVDRTNAYLDKAHAWHIGTMPRTKRVLVYTQNGNPMQEAYPLSDICPTGGTQDFHERIARNPATDPTAYELIEIHSHGNITGAQAGSGWYGVFDVKNWPARPQFIHMRHCQTACWDYLGGCLATCYVYNGTPTTLLAIGSTKVTYGSELTPPHYPHYLAQHMTVGEAYRRGWADEAPYWGWDVTVLAGVTIVGDPMLRPLPPPMHVKPDGSDSNSGETWETAKQTIGGAIAALASNTLDGEIWVAAGTYNERITFNHSISLYGGFDGTEESLSERDPAQNQTIIDGGGGGDVITISNRSYSTNRVDGFTIRNTGGSGRGIVCTSSPLVVEKVTFSGNSGANGGGLCVTSSEVTVGNSSFSSNSSTANGGGMYASGCTGAISGCTFAQNTAANQGGGLSLETSSVAVANCSFSGNSACSAGGVLCQGTPSPTFANCTFSNNSATATYGSGGAISCEQSPAAISNCAFSGNTSHYYGGAVSVSQAAASVSACTFTGNTAYSYGGAVHFYNSAAVLAGCLLSGNSSQTYAGGAVACRNGAPTVSGNVIQSNTAFVGAGVYLLSASGTIVNNMILGGSATYGAGIYMAGGSYPNIVNNTIMNNNTPGYYGGGIRCDNSTPTIKNNLIAYNSQGVCAYTGSQVTFSHNCVWANYYGDYDGAWPDEDSIRADPKLVNRACGDYHLAADSPCVDAGTNTGAPTVDFDGHVRPFGGSCDIGAYELCHILVKADSPGPTFDGLTWNTAYHTIGAAMAVANAKDEIWVAQGTYNEAVTMVNGVRLLGGFAGTERVPVERDSSKYTSVITGGSATDAVTFDSVTDQETRLDGFTIHNPNTDGVGVRCFGSGGVIECNTITGNDGGGVRIYEVDSAALMVVARNTITDNSSEEYGGGVYLDTRECAWSYTNAIVAGNLIQGNSAPYGGGICARECDAGMKITSNTIIDNTASNSGGGIYMIDACPTIESNIVVANSIYGISATEGSCNPIVLPLRDNDVWNNSPANYYQVTTGATDISTDPLLVDVQNGDLHLSSGSPCINAGCDDAAGQLDVDIDGEPRIMGVADIGADEYAILHVTTTGNDGNDGFSWAQAKQTVQGAVNASLGRAEVWVKAGTYAGQVSLKSGNQLFGGFAGTETKRTQRDWSTNLTTLNGGSGTSTITMSLIPDPITTVDGFIITSSPAATCKGIYANAACGQIAHNTITGNKGGGIYCANDSVVTVGGNTISGNASTTGGGIGVDSSVVSVIGNTVSGNQGLPSGGYHAGGIFGLWSRVLVSANTISGNSGQWCGGGVLSYGGELWVTGNTVTGNTGGWTGGVASVCSEGDIVGNTVTGNTGGQCGGVLYSNMWYSTISNNLIAGNSGAGLYADDQGEPLITNNTIVDNTGSYGGAYFAATGSPVLQNNVIAFNSGYGVYADEEWGATPDLSHNDVFGNSSGNYTYVSPGTGDISKNPFFVKRNQGNYRLKGKSPCIDAGTNTNAPLIDKDGWPRPVDGDGNGSVITDMGAYERPTDLQCALSMCPNGTHVDVRPVSVIAVFGAADPSGENWVCVENTDRSAGIRVKTEKTFSVGQLLAVSGLIQTDSSTGERYIDADEDSPEADGGTMTLGAIGMRNQWLGGASNGYQPAIKDGFGFYNVGMLVQTWGRVNYVNTGGHYFYMDDGSHLWDTSGHWGVRVVVPSGVTMPSVGAFAKVKGVSGAMALNGYYVRIVRVRSQSDIWTIGSWQYTDMTLTRGQWNSIALPGIPAYPAPESTFVAGAGEPGLQLEGCLQRYDSLYQQWMVEGGGCGDFGESLFGDGFLLWVSQDNSPGWMTIQNTPSEGDQMVSLPVGLEEPWYCSVVGNPFDASVPWANVTVTDGVWSGTLAEAIEAELIHKVCYWNGSTWVQITDLSVGNMSPRVSYEIYPAVSNLALIVPQPE